MLLKWLLQWRDQINLQQTQQSSPYVQTCSVHLHIKCPQRQTTISASLPHFATHCTKQPLHFTPHNRARLLSPFVTVSHCLNFGGLKKACVWRISIFAIYALVAFVSDVNENGNIILLHYNTTFRRKRDDQTNRVIAGAKRYKSGSRIFQRESGLFRGYAIARGPTLSVPRIHRQLCIHCFYNCCSSRKGGRCWQNGWLFWGKGRVLMMQRNVSLAQKMVPWRKVGPLWLREWRLWKDQNTGGKGGRQSHREGGLWRRRGPGRIWHGAVRLWNKQTKNMTLMHSKASLTQRQTW